MLFRSAAANLIENGWLGKNGVVPSWLLPLRWLIGTPLDPRNLLRDFRLKLEAAGRPQMRFHDLRHSAASLLISQGASTRAVMETLGNSQVSITMDLYGHVFDSVKRETADLMDRALKTRSKRDSEPVAATVAAETEQRRPN